MKRLALAAAGLLLAAGAIAATGFSYAADEPRSAFSGGYGSPFIEAAQADGHQVQRLVSSPTALQGEAIQPAETLLVVFDAPRSYSEAERDAVRSFIEAGGTLLVADGTGHATQLTTPLGIAFERVSLVEPTGQYTATLPGTEATLSSQNATALMLDQDAAISVWASSSDSSHLDRDADGTIGEADPPGPFPVLASVSLGKGEAWAISTTGPFEATAHPDAGNQRFLERLVTTLLDDGGLVVVDESRHPHSDPVVAGLSSAARAASTPPWNALALGAAAVLLVLAALPVAWLNWGRHRFEPDRMLLAGKTGTEADEPREGAWWTPRGKAAIGLSGALAIGGLAFQNPQAAWAAAFIITGLAVSLLLRRPKATATRTTTSQRVAERTSVEVAIDVDVGASRSGLEIRDLLHPSVDVQEGSNWGHPTGRKTRLAYTLQPSRLGRYDIGPLYVQREDAYGLRVQRAIIAEADPLCVTPRLDDARRTPFRSRVAEILLGGHQVNRAGSGSEFLALRDYQTGDTMRMVNWKASARSKGLLVNQRVHESPTTLTILLDVRAVSDTGPASRTPFVVGARAAASICHGAMQSRDRVRIILYGDGVQEIPGRGAEQQRALEDAIAQMSATGTTGLADAVRATAKDLRSGRPVVVISSLVEDQGAEAALREIRMRGTQSFLLAPALDVPADAAPESRRQADAMQAAVKRLRANGFHVFEPRHGIGLEDMFRIQGAAA